MIRIIEHSQTTAQKERQAIVIDLLKDGPKKSRHLAGLIGLPIDREPESKITTLLAQLFAKYPVWFDDEEDRWHLLEMPHIPHPIQKTFRFPGSPMIKGMDWCGIGGIQRLWTQGA